MQASTPPLVDRFEALNLTAVRAQSVAAYQTLLQGDKFSLIVDDCRDIVKCCVSKNPIPSVIS